ncbi:hypothetical protein HK405_014040, partial [Cladochytrium tenue]
MAQPTSPLALPGGARASPLPPTPPPRGGAAAAGAIARGGASIGTGGDGVSSSKSSSNSSSSSPGSTGREHHGLPATVAGVVMAPFTAAPAAVAMAASAATSSAGRAAGVVARPLLMISSSLASLANPTPPATAAIGAPPTASSNTSSNITTTTTTTTSSSSSSSSSSSVASVSSSVSASSSAVRFTPDRDRFENLPSISYESSSSSSYESSPTSLRHRGTGVGGTASPAMTVGTGSRSSGSDPVDLLQALFPDLDAGWARHVLDRHYRGHPDPATALAAKILEGRRGHYPCGDPADAGIRNHALHRLMEMFPDCDVAFMRQAIIACPLDTVQAVIDRLLALERSASSFSSSSSSSSNSSPSWGTAARTPRSTRATAANAVGSADGAGGSAGGYPRRLLLDPLEPADLFHSAKYVAGATHRLYADYPDHWKSSIRAVLAECNFHYPTAWLKMRDVRAPTWWLPFGRRRAYRHAPEMDDEMLLADVGELARLRTLAQAAGDADVARELNRQEYLAAGQLIACGCCFADVAFEDLCQCADGHVFCLTCLASFVEIGLFQTGLLRGREAVCLAGCGKPFAPQEVRRAVPIDVFLAYDRLIFERHLDGSGLLLAQCPFCKYA